MMPNKAISKGSALLLSFQRDTTFFSGCSECLLELGGQYSFRFHLAVTDLLGRRTRSLTKSETNANNRIDVTVVDKEPTAGPRSSGFGVDRNVVFRVASFRRSYQPRDDREPWKEAGAKYFVAINDTAGHTPIEPTRQIRLNAHSAIYAFDRPLIPTSDHSLELYVSSSTGFLESYSYLLHWPLTRLGLKPVLFRDKRVGANSIIGKKATDLDKELGKGSDLTELQTVDDQVASWDFADYRIEVARYLDDNDIHTIRALSKENERSLEQILTDLGLPNLRIEKGVAVPYLLRVPDGSQRNVLVSWDNSTRWLTVVGRSETRSPSVRKEQREQPSGPGELDATGKWMMFLAAKNGYGVMTATICERVPEALRQYNVPGQAVIRIQLVDARISNKDAEAALLRLRPAPEQAYAPYAIVEMTESQVRRGSKTFYVFFEQAAEVLAGAHEFQVEISEPSARGQTGEQYSVRFVRQ